VLAGLTGALLAQDLAGEHAGALAAWLHGAAGEALPCDGATADDLVGQLPEAVRLLRRTHAGDHARQGLE
jgi:NAD(P)H-hydrate repair Nnr-like enzyme with NAD(P)H-hydrate dehydratase domain